MRLERAAWQREAAIECERHAEFLKREALNGGDAPYLLIRREEAQYNAERILAIPTDRAVALADRIAAAAGAGVSRGAEPLLEKWRGERKKLIEGPLTSYGEGRIDQLFDCCAELEIREKELLTDRAERVREAVREEHDRIFSVLDTVEAVTVERRLAAHRAAAGAPEETK
jgi:hypothetical protein